MEAAVVAAAGHRVGIAAPQVEVWRMYREERQGAELGQSAVQIDVHTEAVVVDDTVGAEVEPGRDAERIVEGPDDLVDHMRAERQLEEGLPVDLAQTVAKERVVVKVAEEREVSLEDIDAGFQELPVYVVVATAVGRLVLQTRSPDRQAYQKE